MAVRDTDRRSSVKHEAILRAATRIFLRDGYARASVAAIATGAGVGKETLYKHFASKEGLFLAAVDHARAAAGLGADGGAGLIVDTGDVTADLPATGERLVRALLAPEVAALHRLTIAEHGHHPQLQRYWRDGDDTQVHLDDAMADYFATCDRRGDLAVPDPALAASHFTTLLAAHARVRSLYGSQPLTDDEIRTIAKDTAELFLRAYGR
ncbi:TetR/AcrR family transcriptional regulator [Fodinicola acaciae]|uniref:TetR/AcrR family transcriptional regulator n=1 Tax=Fodinicola acaciae TaxID=2681555 RepID=UPI0013D42B3C|nr:TetR/AcrR family transcriptional regulator [Fodinicola acaciae]